MLLIDGQWRAGKGADMHSENPADGSRVWSGKAATADDVDAAFKAARAAFPARRFGAASLSDPFPFLSDRSDPLSL